MKGHIFIALIIVIVAIQLIPTGCSNVGTEAYDSPVTGAVFVSADEAWVLTRKGVLKHISTDGQSINIADAQQRVQGMSFLSRTQGWTVDLDWNTWHFDGARWAAVGQNNDNRFGLVRSSSVIFVDDKVGWARTLVPLFITDDGGRTWKKVLVTEPGEFTELFIVDGDNAFLYGPRGSVRHTTDRGKTWTDRPLRDAGDVTSFVCHDGAGGECWAGTARGEVFAISGDSVRRLHLPEDFEKIGIFSIFFNGTRSALLAGGTYGEHPVGWLLKTDDEGQTWAKVEAPRDKRFEKVASFGSTIWLASHASIYRSSDAGGSWAKIYDASK